MSNGNDKSLVKDPYKDISFSRRGLFAALAVVAGRGSGACTVCHGKGTVVSR